MNSPKTKLAEAKVREYLDDPIKFVVERFGAEPDPWQADVLRVLPTTERIALSACKGPGKSCLEAWIGWWILGLHPLAQGIATSITRENLRDNLWKELAYWHGRDEYVKGHFDVGGERIASKHRAKVWWLSARGFAADADKTQQANTLAGLHAKFVFILLDEVGDYPEGVVAAAEGIFANKDSRAWLVMGGNPTRIPSPLHTATTRDRKRWHVVYITGDPDDLKRSSRISKEWAQQQIELWGRDNPWVMVNVLGQFPPQSSDTLISIDTVQAAMARDVRPEVIAADAHIGGLDPSRFGDDEAVFTHRKGLCMWRQDVFRNLDGVQLAEKVAMRLQQFEERGDPIDVLFVDVGGVGASCYDHLKFLGWSHVILAVDFGSSADDPRFFNKRSEIWWRGAEWLRKRPAALPADPILASELVGPKFNYRVVQKQTRFMLESKDDMKSRGLSSPNRGDSLMLTFAGNVQKRAKLLLREDAAKTGGRQRARTEYDVHREV